MAAEGMYEAQSPGGVSSTPELRDPLGPPQIVTGPEYMKALASLGYNVENLSSPLPTMTKIAGSLTSLIDNQYNQAMQWAKSKADVNEAVARTSQIGANTDLIRQRSDQDQQLFPLQIQGEQLNLQGRQQSIKENEFRLNEAQRNADETDKAHNQYQAWHDELAQLDPTDPDYDNKIASINAKYPEASTNPSTQRLISPLLQQQNVKRGQSFLVQQRTDQMNQLRGFQQNGLIPPDTDIQKEVAAGNGQSMVNRAKQQSALNRLQTITAYGNPSERLWAQNQVNDITGVNRGPNETPPPMFGPNGDLNPGSEALLSTIERRIGITPVVPGAKKETKITTDETGTKTETTITGQPVTAQDIAKPAQPTVTTAMPTRPEDMQKDPVFQSVFSDLAAGKLALPGNPKPGTPEYTAGLFAEYSKRKAAAAQQPPPGQGTTQPVTIPSPAPAPSPQRASKAGRRGLSEAGGPPPPSPGATPQLPTSNNDYRFPAGASNLAGIDRNVWANVMSEEGREFGKDGSHDSVFGLWADAPGAEGDAYRAVRQHGPDSLAAYNAVTNAWTQAFLQQSRPWDLNSPGLQEMVIADSQHRGGAAARAIIDRMGGYAAVNSMDPADAIRTYSDLRKPLWPGNNRPFPDGASDRVTREMGWALRHDRQLAGAQGQLGGPQTSATLLNSALPRPATIEEAQALPTGTHFIDPEGNRRMVA